MVVDELVGVFCDGCIDAGLWKFPAVEETDGFVRFIAADDFLLPLDSVAAASSPSSTSPLDEIPMLSSPMKRMQSLTTDLRNPTIPSWKRSEKVRGRAFQSPTVRSPEALAKQVLSGDTARPKTHEA